MVCVVSRDLAAYDERLELEEQEEVYFQEQYEWYLGKGFSEFEAEQKAEKDLRDVCRECYGFGCPACDSSYFM